MTRKIQGDLMDAVRADCRLAASPGVRETPTVFIVTTVDFAALLVRPGTDPLPAPGCTV